MNVENVPFVSVLVTAKDEEKYIGKTLESLENQSYPKDNYEIIVLDNESEDGTRLEVEKHNAKYIYSSANTIGKVRNELAAAAKGVVLAYIDGDCTAEDDWIKNGVTLLKTDNVVAVGGYTNPPDDATWLGRGCSLKRSPIEKSTNILATGSFFIRRDTFESLNGFNEDLKASEDTDISNRIVSNGNKLVISPSISVVHWGFPDTILDFMKRQILQTSNYWKSRKPGLDPIFFATSIVLVALIGSVVFLGLGLYLLSISLVFVYLLVSVTLGVYRLFRSDEKNKLIKFPGVLLTQLLYLLARSIGLFISTLRILSIVPKKV